MACVSKLNSRRKIFNWCGIIVYILDITSVKAVIISGNEDFCITGKHFICVNSFNLTTTLQGKHYSYSCFTDRDIEIQRD